MSVILFTCFFIRLGIYTDKSWCSCRFTVVFQLIPPTWPSFTSGMSCLGKADRGRNRNSAISCSNLILYRNGYIAIDTNSFQTHIINLQILSHFRSIHLTRFKLILLVRNPSHCNFLHDRVICKVDKLSKQ